MNRNKIDIAYLKKNFDLKKFLKFISKPSGIEENFEIYYDFIKACETKEIKSDQLFDILENQKKDIMYSFADKFANGKFFPFISNNFKVLELCKITEAGDTDPSLKEYYYVQLISSKINKKYYIASYHGKYTTINDSYNIIKWFKIKQKAYDFLEVFVFKKDTEFANSGR